jgi:hypothetical protein
MLAPYVLLLITSSSRQRGRHGRAILRARLEAPRAPVPQRKNLAAAKSVVLFALPPPSPDLPIEAVIEFINAPNMVVAAH